MYTISDSEKLNDVMVMLREELKDAAIADDEIKHTHILSIYIKALGILSPRG